ncbi:hypothetical protein FJZ31_04220 [Candidatus Poribacteria bacterium]|nr:hypothetical protein [Candidatus Poribacteria bacterium]
MFASLTDAFVPLKKGPDSRKGQGRCRFSKALTLLLLFFFLSSIAFGEILFKDDFEQDTTGREPAKWKTALGIGKGEIVKDPAGSNSKVFRAPECDERGGDFYLIGEKNWDNYEIMWDWYFVDAIKEGIGTSNNSSLQTFLLKRKV